MSGAKHGTFVINHARVEERFRYSQAINAIVLFRVQNQNDKNIGEAMSNNLTLGNRFSESVTNERISYPYPVVCHTGIRTLRAVAFGLLQADILNAKLKP